MSLLVHLIIYYLKENELYSGGLASSFLLRYALMVVTYLTVNRIRNGY
jgi:hypothetical protein